MGAGSGGVGGGRADPCQRRQRDGDRVGAGQGDDLAAAVGGGLDGVADARDQAAAPTDHGEPGGRSSARRAVQVMVPKASSRALRTGSSTRTTE